jgi:quercetin dioxygenase-like cupin family protein
MDAVSETRGERLIVEPKAAESYWQPVPANGYVTVLVAPHLVAMANPFAMGTQTVAPNSFVREHGHGENEETIYVLSGRGIAVLDGEEHVMEPGKLFFLGSNRTHKFINTGSEDMTFLWVMLPPGLEQFFAAIGKPRKPGDPAPANFPRPENILQIEADTVFNSALTPDAR